MVKTRSNIVEKVEQDPFYKKLFAEGTADILSRNKEMIAEGIIDSKGKFLPEELPEDMKEDSDTDI